MHGPVNVKCGLLFLSSFICVFWFVFFRYILVYSLSFFISFFLMSNRLLFITWIQLRQWSINPYLQEPSCVVVHRSVMTLFVYIDRTRCHHWHRIIIQRGQNKHTSGCSLTGEKFSKINSYGRYPFLENDMRANLFMHLLVTLSHAPSLLCVLYIVHNASVVFSTGFLFLHRFSVQIIGRQCNSRLVRPIGSQSSASSYTLLVDSVVLMRRFTLLFLFRIRMSLEFKWPTFIAW
jgi:hypothetical protein